MIMPHAPQLRRIARAHGLARVRLFRLDSPMGVFGVSVSNEARSHGRASLSISAACVAFSMPRGITRARLNIRRADAAHQAESAIVARLRDMKQYCHAAMQRCLRRRASITSTRPKAWRGRRYHHASAVTKPAYRLNHIAISRHPLCARNFHIHRVLRLSPAIRHYHDISYFDSHHRPILRRRPTGGSLFAK